LRIDSIVNAGEQAKPTSSTSLVFDEGKCSNPSNLATDALQIRAVRLTDGHHRRLSHGMHNQILAEQ
jgi:hypothetical protein